MFNTVQTPGDILDRISILIRKIDLSNSKMIPLSELSEVLTSFLLEVNKGYLRDIEPLFHDLHEANTKLWNAEALIRSMDSDNERRLNVIEEIHIWNAKRAKIKQELNRLLLSDISEVKDYSL